MGPVLDEVAICFDKENGTRHKHGAPESVRNWHAMSQAKLRAGGFDEMADDLIVIQARFTLEDLNKVLDISGYAKKLYDDIMSGKAAALDITGKLIAPA